MNKRMLLDEKIDFLKNCEELKIIQSHYQEPYKLLDKLALSLLVSFFSTNKIFMDAGESHSLEDIKAAIHLHRKYDKFLNYLLSYLSTNGIIIDDNKNFSLIKKSDDNPSSIAAVLIKSYPELQGMCHLLNYSISHYSNVLSGQDSSVSIFFPNGDANFLQSLLGTFSKNYSNITTCKNILKNLIVQLSNSTTLNILEVGGGFGELTWELVPQLNMSNINYLFTDISHYFLMNAAKEAKRRNLSVNFNKFDISMSASHQKLQTTQFDCIIALNVLHATPNLVESIKNLVELISEDGFLCIIEYVKSPLWANAIWGLTEGWWCFNDSFRKNNPLINLLTWKKVLRSCGFKKIFSYPNNDLNADSCLLIAQKC